MKAVGHTALLGLCCLTAWCEHSTEDGLQEPRPGFAFLQEDSKREGLFVTGPLFEQNPLVITQSQATNGARFLVLNQCGKDIFIAEPKVYGSYRYDCPAPPEIQKRYGTDRMSSGSFWSYGGRSFEPYHHQFELLQGHPRGPDGEFFACGCCTKFARLVIPEGAILAAPTTISGRVEITLDYVVLGEAFLRRACVSNQVAIAIVPDPPLGDGSKP